MREIVAHVVRHEAVYGSLNRISSVFALRIVLAEHIEQSVRIILREGFVVPPDTGPEAAQLYAAFIAHGAVGAVEAWLHLPAPRDERLLLDRKSGVSGTRVSVRVDLGGWRDI